MRAATLAAVALAAAGATVGIATPADAATLEVCASGCSYSTIAAAVTAAAPGDTVDVAAGTYTENGIAVTKAITIRGAGKGQTIVDGGGLATSPRVGIFQIRPAATATSGVGTITIADMTVRNPSKQGSFYMNFSIGMKVAATGVTDITLDGLAVEGTNDAAKWNYGIYADGGAPIAGAERKAPSLVIKDSAFTKTAFNNIGVDAWFGPVRIENNDLTESVSGGKSGIILLNEYTAAQITDPVVVTGNRSVGRLFWLSNIPVPDRPGWADVTVSDNTATDLGPTDPGIHVDTNTSVTGAQYRNGTVRITGNDLSASGCPAGSAGIEVNGMQDHAVITGNTLTEVQTGISAGTNKGAAPAAVDISGNTLTGCGTDAGTTGISLRGAVGDTEITGNNVVGWDAALRLSAQDQAEPDSVTTTRNRFFADVHGLVNTTATELASSSDWWGCHDPTDAANGYCSAIDGPIALTNWLALEASPTPAPDGDGLVHVTAGQTVPISFDFVVTDGSDRAAATGLPSFFDDLPLALAATAGSHTGPSALGAGYRAETSYTAPGVAGADTATGGVDRETLASGETVVGEPVPVRFAIVEVAGPGDPGDSGGTDGGSTPAGPVNPGAGTLPDTGAPIAPWMPALGLALVAVGLSMTRRPAIARPGRPGRPGRHRVTADASRPGRHRDGA